MSMLNQLFTARLILSDKYYRKPSTPVGPTGAVAGLEIVELDPIIQVLQSEMAIEEGAVGKQQDEENATVYDVESVRDDVTVYDQEYVTHCSDAESDVRLHTRALRFF